MKSGFFVHYEYDSGQIGYNNLLITEEQSMLFNILLYAIMIFMIVRIFVTNKIVKKNRRIIDLLGTIEDEELFFTTADDIIATINDPCYENKTRVIRLWGLVYHNRLDEFGDALNEIEIEKLFAVKKGAVSIEHTEDSFFYLLLSIPNLLYGKRNKECRTLIDEKVSAYSTELENQLTYGIYKNCNLFYDGKEDLGEKFFRDVDQGNYPGYKYSKQLIGLYKNICDTMLAKILSDRGEDTTELMEFIVPFAERSVGNRWVRSIGLNLWPAYSDEYKDPSEDGPEEMTEDDVPAIEAPKEEDYEADDYASDEPEDVIEAVTEEKEENEENE